MNDEESSQSAELNSYHRDINPSLGAGFGGFIIAGQPALAHQPTEGAFYDPAVGQYFEASEVIRTFDDHDGQFWAEPLDPLGESLAGVATIHPQNAQPGEPAQNPAQEHLGSVAFGGASRGHRHAEHQPQSIHQQMAFAAFDPLAGVIPDVTAVAGGLDALTVQYRGRGPAALAVSFPHEDAQGVVERGPLMVVHPLPEDMIHGFPMGKVDGQITPRATTLDQIEDGINDAPPIHRRAAAFGRFGQHRFEISPLGIRETGVIYGVFHAPTEAALKIGRRIPSRMSTHPATFLSCPIKKQIIQTHSKGKEAGRN